MIKPKINPEFEGGEKCWNVVNYLTLSLKEHFAASTVAGFFWSPSEQAEAVMAAAGQNRAFRDLYIDTLADPPLFMKQLADISESDGPASIALWDFTKDSIFTNKISFAYFRILKSLVSRSISSRLFSRKC